jgi:(p)ppGpp synthase/HD superfamily hydrolase
VQVDPIKPTLKAPGTKRFKLEYVELLSSFAFNVKLRRYTKEEVECCFDLLRAVHTMYRPVPGEYDDYITNPKRSGYQSLHTAVDGPDGALLEVQVRTRAMHNAAEFGNAAHWLYKVGRCDDTNVESAWNVTLETKI